MSNPVPGVCPCCKKNSVFLQSIHSNALFSMLEPYGKFKRGSLFCDKCIGWAKAEVMRLREQPQQAASYHQPPIQQQYSPISETGGSRSTPDPYILPLVAPDDNVGSRLANPNASPIPFTTSVLPYFLCAPWPAARPNELPLLNTMLGTNVQLGTVAPLPSPNLVNEPQEEPQENAQEPN